MVQNDKKILSIALHIWGTTHHMTVIYVCKIIWLSFMVHMCKMIISLGIFFIFLNFDFSVCKRAKYRPKWKKILSITFHIWGTMHHTTVIYVCKMIISSGVFSIFLKILIFWVHREVKGQKTVQNDKNLCLLCSLSQEPDIIWLSFMVQMYKMISPGIWGFDNWHTLHTYARLLLLAYTSFWTCVHWDIRSFFLLWFFKA